MVVLECTLARHHCSLESPEMLHHYLGSHIHHVVVKLTDNGDELSRTSELSHDLPLSAMKYQMPVLHQQMWCKDFDTALGISLECQETPCQCQETPCQLTLRKTPCQLFHVQHGNHTVHLENGLWPESQSGSWASAEQRFYQWCWGEKFLCGFIAQSVAFTLEYMDNGSIFEVLWQCAFVPEGYKKKKIHVGFVCVESHTL